MRVRKLGARRLGGVLGLLLALSLVLFPVAPALAVPPQPHQFWGTVTIDAELAPVGTIVSAQIGEDPYLSTTVDAEGRYGYILEVGGTGTFKVPADDPDEPGKDGGETGEIVEFYITNEAMGLEGVKANETAEFEIWGTTLLPLTVRADTTPPTLVITTPEADAVVSSQDTIAGTITEANSVYEAGVKIQRASDSQYWTGTDWQAGEVWVLATVSGEAPDFAFSYDSSAIIGEDTYTVAAAAVDGAGNENISADVSYSIDVTAPEVTIDTVTSPTDNATQSLTGTRSAELTVVLTADTAATFGDVSYTTTTTWSCYVTLVEGSNVITATVTDAAENTATDTATIELILPPDTTPPTVVSTTPTANAASVARDAVVSAIFDEAIQAGDNFSAVAISGATVSASIDGVTLTIAHDAFAYEGTYEVTIPAGAVNDLNDNSLAEAKVWSFTVVAETEPTDEPTDEEDVGVGGAPAVTYTETELFGTEARFRISDEGEVLKTIEATSEDGDLTVTITKGTIALDKDGDPLESLEAAVDESPPDPPEDAHIIGLTYDFGPAGATFDPAIPLTWSYDPDEIPRGVTEEDLVIAYYDGTEWVELDCVVDTENNTITASVSHFSKYAIIARTAPTPAPATFSASSLSVLPAEVEPKDAVTITVSVANTGGESGSYVVVLKINEVKEAQKTAIIAAGSSLDVSFTVTREEPASYTVTIAGLSASFTVAAPPEEEEEVVEEVVVVEEEEEELIPAPPTNWALIGGIIAAVIVVIFIVCFLLVRRRRAA